MTPLELVTEKRDEIITEYERVLKVTCGHKHTKAFRDFEADKKKDLLEILKRIDQYNKAVNTLSEVSETQQVVK